MHTEGAFTPAWFMFKHTGAFSSVGWCDLVNCELSSGAA